MADQVSVHSEALHTRAVGRPSPHHRQHRFTPFPASSLWLSSRNLWVHKDSYPTTAPKVLAELCSKGQSPWLAYILVKTLFTRSWPSLETGHPTPGCPRRLYVPSLQALLPCFTAYLAQNGFLRFGRFRDRTARTQLFTSMSGESFHVVPTFILCGKV